MAFPHNPRGQTILVIDDEPGVVKLAKGVLERGGYSVLSASDAEEGLKVLEGHPRNRPDPNRRDDAGSVGN
jgi:CheY-like chemotaxis protein